MLHSWLFFGDQIEKVGKADNASECWSHALYLNNFAIVCIEKINDPVEGTLKSMLSPADHTSFCPTGKCLQLFHFVNEKWINQVIHDIKNDQRIWFQSPKLRSLAFEKIQPNARDTGSHGQLQDFIIDCEKHNFVHIERICLNRMDPKILAKYNDPNYPYNGYIID